MKKFITKHYGLIITLIAFIPLLVPPAFAGGGN
jgi:hypothetical protein